MMRENLYERMSYLSKLSNDEINKVLLAASYNDSRMVTKELKDRCALAKSSFEKRYTCQSLGSVEKGTWKEDILRACSIISNISDLSDIERSFILNNWLISEGICPFVRYVFSKWHHIRTVKDVELISELSPVYLYKVVPHQYELIDSDHDFLATGAYGRVYRDTKNNSIVKYPHNLAAKLFMNDVEMSVYNMSQGSKLRYYLAPVIDYNSHKAIIRKIFIEGVSGWELLETNQAFRKDPYNIAEIEEIYNLVCDLYKTTGVNIDIHPGNFQWSCKENRWYLIDYGAMPEIGADYFPRDNFQAYFKKIWLDLHDLIRKVPIRSLDIEVPENIV